MLKNGGQIENDIVTSLFKQDAPNQKNPRYPVRKHFYQVERDTRLSGTQETDTAEIDALSSRQALGFGREGRVWLLQNNGTGNGLKKKE